MNERILEYFLKILHKITFLKGIQNRYHMKINEEMFELSH